MKIAMVSEHASPLASIGGVDAGGQNVHVAALAAALTRQGHDVTVFTRRDNERLPVRVQTSQGYAVEHVPAGPPRPIPKDDLLPLMPDFGRYLVGRAVEESFDVIHAHFWMSGLAAMPSRAVVGTPVVMTFHALGTTKRRHQGHEDTSPDTRIDRETELCESVDYVVATSADEVFELRRMGMPTARVGVVPCGVDVDAFTPAGPASSRTRGYRRAVAISRLVPRKGLEDAIRALALLPDVELVIAGGTANRPGWADPEAQRLRLIAAEVGVGDRVVFLGPVPRPSVPALLRSADVFLATPWYEPFGMSALEAMACGVPVVATAVGGLADTVVDGVTGIHVRPHDPRSIALAAGVLLDDRELAHEYGTAGAQRARSRYSWDAVGRLTVQAYRRALRLQAVPLRPRRVAR